MQAIGLIDSEDLTAEELEMLRNFTLNCQKLAKKEQDLKQTHSIEDAVEDEETKEQNQKNRPLKPGKTKKS